MNWKDISKVKPAPFEVVLFCSKFLNKYGRQGLKYDTGVMLRNGDISLHHGSKDTWEPTSWLRVKLPFQPQADTKRNVRDYEK